jgi:catalase
MIHFSDRGTPDGYYQVHGYSGHTFKWCKADGSFVYVQVHVRAEGGFKVNYLISMIIQLMTEFFFLADYGQRDRD